MPGKNQVWKPFLDACKRQQIKVNMLSPPHDTLRPFMETFFAKTNDGFSTRTLLEQCGIDTATANYEAIFAAFEDIHVGSVEISLRRSIMSRNWTMRLPLTTPS